MARSVAARAMNLGVWDLTRWTPSKQAELDRVPQVSESPSSRWELFQFIMAGGAEAAFRCRGVPVGGPRARTLQRRRGQRARHGLEGDLAHDARARRPR